MTRASTLASVLGAALTLSTSCTSTVQRDYIHCEPAQRPNCANQPRPALGLCHEPVSVEGPMPHGGQCCFLVTVEETDRVPSQGATCASGD
ncbi:MAG: hypothetical protein IT374_12000 [Polyangiaceae bacterium]|nr:hypothetical protein [Polyangiaceae bacterium]